MSYFCQDVGEETQKILEKDNPLLAWNTYFTERCRDTGTVKLNQPKSPITKCLDAKNIGSTDGNNINSKENKKTFCFFHDEKHLPTNVPKTKKIPLTPYKGL